MFLLTVTLFQLKVKSFSASVKLDLQMDLEIYATLKDLICIPKTDREELYVIYVKNTLKCKVIHELSIADDCFESVFLNVDQGHHLP